VSPGRYASASTPAPVRTVDGRPTLRDQGETVDEHPRIEASDRRVEMKRWIVACAVSACVVTGVATQAGASEPVVQACVGTTFSGAAQTLRDLGAPPGSIGAILSGFAQQPDGHPGLGDGIQQLQAGLTPDSVAVNTCNG
jgi:hypothetical protein